MFPDPLLPAHVQSLHQLLELSRDCLVNGREESLLSRARALYEDRAHGEFGDGQAAYDWNRAQAQKDNRNEFMH